MKLLDGSHLGDHDDCYDSYCASLTKASLTKAKKVSIRLKDWVCNGLGNAEASSSEASNAASTKPFGVLAVELQFRGVC